MTMMMMMTTMMCLGWARRQQSRDRDLNPIRTVSIAYQLLNYTAPYQAPLVSGTFLRFFSHNFVLFCILQYTALICIKMIIRKKLFLLANGSHAQCLDLIDEYCRKFKKKEFNDVLTNLSSTMQTIVGCLLEEQNSGPMGGRGHPIPGLDLGNTAKSWSICYLGVRYAWNTCFMCVILLALVFIKMSSFFTLVVPSDTMRLLAAIKMMQNLIIVGDIFKCDSFD